MPKFSSLHITVAAGASKVAKREADEEKVAVTISLIGKTAVFPDYPLLKLRVSLQNFWKLTTNLKFLKLQRLTASITLFRAKLKA